MALDQKFFKKSTAASGLTDQEEGLVLHLDANDVDSYDGDGSIWYDITKHEVNIPLVDKGTDLVLHLNSSDTASYPGYGTTWTDLSTYGNDAVKVDSPTYGADTRGYFDLDGSNDRFLISNDSSMFMTSNTGFTIELWVNRDSNAEMYFITPRDGSTYPYTLAWSGNTTHGYYGWISGSGYTSNVGLNEGTTNGIGEWDHVVLTQSSSDRKDRLYVNGTLTATSAARSGFHSSSADINIGAYWGDNAYVDGKIGVVRVYKTELTSAEIGQNFRAGHNLSYSSVITSKHQATQGALHTSNLQIDLDANSYSGSGNWLDGANDYDASITAATYVNDVNSDYFDFAGSTAHPVSISYNSILNAAARTWEFWVWFDTDAMNFFGGMWGNQSDNSTKTVLFRMKDGNNAIRAQVYEGAGGSAVEPTTANNVVKTNEWNHIVFTSDNSDNSFKIYVNGVEKYSTTLSFDINTSSTENFIIGAGGGYSSNRLNGRVAQFRYYNAALTSAQVNTNYNATKALYQHPTAFIDYRPDQYSGSGTSITNLGSLSNNAVLTGSPPPLYDEELGDYFLFDSNSSNKAIETASNVSGVNLNTDGFSWEYWVWVSTDYQGYIASLNYSTTYYNMSYRSNLNTIIMFTSGAYISSSTIELNKWHHIVATANSSGHKLYTNGVLTGSNTTAASNHNLNSKLYFGRYHSATAADARHKGNLGDMRFYKGVLTAEQVAQNYLATKNKYPNGINFTGNNISWNANGYFSFNGSNKNFATSGAPSALINATGFTVSAWLWRTNGATGSNTIVGQSHDNGNSGQNWILTVHGSGTVYFHIYGTDDYSGVSNLVSYETWTHLAGVVEDDGVKRIYKNGVVQLSTASGKSADTVSYDTFVGNLGAINWHDGRIGAVKYYKKPLTADELLADFNATKGTYGL